MKLCALLCAISAFTLPACARSPESTLRPTATIKDIMDSIVDPSADTLWDSVSTIESAAGVEERQPRTDEEWKVVHRAAVTLVEATNLLLVEHRRVAKPGEKAENRPVELPPEQIEAEIEKDRQAWIDRAHKLHDAAVPALKATEEHNVQGLLDAGEAIDAACENCHLKYWYPNSRQTEAVSRQVARP